MDRIDRIVSCEWGFLLNFGARKVEVKRKVKELRERPVHPVILSKKGFALIRWYLCKGGLPPRGVPRLEGALISLQVEL